MELVLVDKTNYLKAVEIQNTIFPKENGTLNILASLGRDMFMNLTGLSYVDDHVRYYLAKEGNEYIGITGIYHYDDEDAWLAWFGILKNYRRNGYGEELLQRTIDIAKSMSFKNMRIYTDFIELHNACLLYEKNGFIGEKYTAEELPYDCRIYSKSLIGKEVELWNNKNLGLSYQSELEGISEDRINEILEIYKNIL